MEDLSFSSPLSLLHSHAAFAKRIRTAKIDNHILTPKDFFFHFLKEFIDSLYFQFDDHVALISTLTDVVLQTSKQQEAS